MRRIKIVNKVRFFMFVGLLIFIGILSISLISNAAGFNSSNDLDLDFISQFNQVKVTIKPGDTSWVIQNSLAPGFDTRETLFHAGKINGKKMGNIKPGEVLIFLEER